MLPFNRGNFESLQAETARLKDLVTELTAGLTISTAKLVEINGYKQTKPRRKSASSKGSRRDG